MKNTFIKTFHHKRLRKSFMHAVEGLVYILKYHYNAQLIFVLAIIAAAFGIALKVTYLEMLILLVTITLVFVAEIFNTMVEEVTDLVTEKKYHPAAKTIKDISAAAVLIASLLSLAVGYSVFGQRLYDVFLPMLTSL